MRRREQPPGDEAFHALSSLNSWVNNADAKIGLLAAALTVLASGVVRQRHRVELALSDATAVRTRVGLALFAVCVIALGVSAVYLYRGLRARLDGEVSRFGFPHAAQADVPALTSGNPRQIRHEAWTQVHTLSRIVMKKYRCFNAALLSAMISAVALVGWLVLWPGA